MTNSNIDLDIDNLQIDSNYQKNKTYIIAMLQKTSKKVYNKNSQLSLQSKVEKQEKSLIKNDYQLGYLLVYVQNFQIISPQLFEGAEQMWLQISINNVCRKEYFKQTDVLKKQKRLKVDQSFIFIGKADQKIKFQIKKINSEAKNQIYQQISQKQISVCQCQFPILQLFNIPRVRHCLQVDFAHIVKQSKQRMTVSKACSAVIQILHINQDIGKLQMTIIQGELYRDTQVAGKMDPYIIIKYNETTYRTKTLVNGGKKPSWNEKIVIPIATIGKINELQIYMHDRDIINDDLVGSATLNLMDPKFQCLYPSSKPKVQVLNLKYQGDKPAGNIKIQYRFYLNQT